MHSLEIEPPGDEVTDRIHHAAVALRRERAQAAVPTLGRTFLGPCDVLVRRLGDPRWRRVGGYRQRA